MNHEKLGLGDKEISLLPECHFALQHICYTIFVQEDEDGKPYKCKHACRSSFSRHLLPLYLGSCDFSFLSSLSLPLQRRRTPFLGSALLLGRSHLSCCRFAPKAHLAWYQLYHHIFHKILLQILGSM